MNVKQARKKKGRRLHDGRSPRPIAREKEGAVWGSWDALRDFRGHPVSGIRIKVRADLMRRELPTGCARHIDHALGRNFPLPLTRRFPGDVDSAGECRHVAVPVLDDRFWLEHFLYVAHGARRRQAATA